MQSFSWKFLTASLRTEDRKTLFSYPCTHCHGIDTFLHRFIECKKAKKIWNFIFYKLGISLSPNSNKDKVDLLMFLNPFKDNIPDILAAIITHLILWIIHSSYIYEINNNKAITVSHLLDMLKSTHTKIFYTMFFSKDLSLKEKKLVMNLKSCALITIDLNKHKAGFL